MYFVTLHQANTMVQLIRLSRIPFVDHLWSNKNIDSLFKTSTMTPTEVFSIANLIAMPMWALMIFLPKWKVTRFLIDFKLIPIVLSVLYFVYIFISLKQGNGMDFSSLETVMELFTSENAVLAGWIHYLAFDLLVGMWIISENKKLNIHHVLIVPCLLGSFMLGPIGFLLFMIMKTIKKLRS